MWCLRLAKAKTDTLPLTLGYRAINFAIQVQASTIRRKKAHSTKSSDMRNMQSNAFRVWRAVFPREITNWVFFIRKTFNAIETVLIQRSHTDVNCIVLILQNDRNHLHIDDFFCISTKRCLARDLNTWAFSFKCSASIDNLVNRSPPSPRCLNAIDNGDDVELVGSISIFSSSSSVQSSSVQQLITIDCTSQGSVLGVKLQYASYTPDKTQPISTSLIRSIDCCGVSFHGIRNDFYW